MIADAPDFEAIAGFGAGICVIGGGPVGLIVALELARRGRRVLVLESGGRRARGAAQALSEAENLNPGAHFAPEITVARRLGGTSNLWGGRCLPMDAIDFAPRPWLGLPAWPIGPEELAPWLGPACAALAAGEPVFHEPLEGVAADPAFGFEGLERWSNVPRAQRLHRRALQRPGILVALGVTALGFDWADGRIAGTMKTPVAAGTVQMTGFGASLPALGVRYEKGELAGRLAEDRFHVSAVRAGGIVGDHTVGFDSGGDEILLEHRARSRRGFATGAVLAAEWIVGKTGVFGFDAVLDDLTR